jgi:hypothetical protein
MRAPFVFVAVGLLSQFVIVGTAEAASGRLRGYWKFQQYGGGYCGESADPDWCAGARYVEADYATAQPIRNGRIYVEDHNGADIGSCATAADGYFDCNWSRATMPTQIRAAFRFGDAGNRFVVLGSGGSGGYQVHTGWYVVSNGENKYIGTVTTSKMGIAHLFAAGARAWNDSFDTSFWLAAEFNGIEFWAYDANGCGGASLCANGTNVVVGNSAKAYETFNVMHELGHVADYVLDPRDLIMDHASNYCYPNTNGSGCSHDISSSEWRGVARAEGLASFFALTALWENDAPMVRSCIGDGDGMACSAQSYEMAEEETTCTGVVGRKEYTSVRYFWDLFDSTNESGEAVTATLGDITESILTTPVGHNFGENESFYAANGSTVDAWDSFHQWEWNEQFEASSSINSSPVYYHNCLGYF